MHDWAEARCQFRDASPTMIVNRSRLAQGTERKPEFAAACLGGRLRGHDDGVGSSPGKDGFSTD